VSLLLLGTPLPGFADNGLAASEALEASIQKRLLDGEFTEKTKNFGWSASGCQISGYPILERSLALDPSGNVRRFVQKQIVSHGSIDTIRSYFDEAGTLRLVDHELGSTVDRVFLDPSGQIVKSIVSHDARKTWRDASFELSDYFMRPSSAAGARSTFLKEEPTCEPSAG